MHVTRLFFAAFISLLLFSACNSTVSDGKAIFGVWRLSDISGESSAEAGGDKLLQSAKDKELLKEGMVFSFFPDNTFTQINGNGGYISGTWQWNEEGINIRLVYDNKKEDRVIEVQKAVDQKESMTMATTGGKQQLSFVKYADLLKDFKEDPFYSSHNKWRIKATASESEAQILERLGNYLAHMTYILKSSYERNQEVISFEFSMGIVKIYNGGIGAHDFALIPQTWKESYFNEGEALKAHELFTRYLSNSSYRGASTGNWVKDDYEIMLSIYGDLKNGKFQSTEIQ